MSFIPEPTRAFSPRRPASSSTAALSPSCNAPISRSSSSASSATGKNKKRSRGEEYLNDLPENTTIIHSPQPATPPPIQSPGKTKQLTSASFGGVREAIGDSISSPMAKLVSLTRGAGGGEAVGDSIGSPIAKLVSLSRGTDEREANRVASLSRGGGGGETNGAVSSSQGGNEDGRETNGAEQLQGERENSPSTDDLLVQLPDYDWSSFMTKFEKTLKEIGAEKEWLSKEYDMWNWMYDIWVSSRDCDDTRRLSREMATIIQWTKLKEVDLEHAREAHTQSMLAISSVLGIVPKNVSPPPLVGKTKKR